MVVHGGGFTVEGQELDRRQLLSDQLKLARQLRGVMERAAETAKTLSPQKARDFYLELEPEICQLVSLTKAVRGEYALDHYHQYDLDTNDVVVQENSNYQQSPTVHSPRNNNDTKLISAVNVIKEQLQDMAYERNPSLFPERNVQRKPPITKEITTTKLGNAILKKKKSRTLKPTQTDTSINRPEDDDNDDDDMLHPTSISITHNAEEMEEKKPHTNVTHDSRSPKRITKDRKEDSKVSTPNILPTDPVDTTYFDTSKSKSHRPNRRKSLNKKFDKTLTKKEDSNNNSTSSRNVQQKKNTDSSKPKETNLQSTPPPPPATAPSNNNNNNNNNNNRRKLSHKRSNPPHSSKVSSEKPSSSPSISVTETPGSSSQKSASSVVKNEQTDDSLPSTPLIESEKNDPTSNTRKKKATSPASSESSSTKKRKTGNSSKKMRKTQNQIRKCHQCKVNGTEYRLCHFWFMNGTKCRKTYCKNCLINLYGLTQDFNTILSDTEWHCPSCLGTCTCPVCVKHRERAEIKQAKRPARASAGFYSFT